MAEKLNKLDPARIAHKERTAEPRFDKTAFTEVFLHRFADEDAWAARHFGKLIEDSTLETYGICAKRPEELLTQCQLRAIVADLRRLEYELAELGKVPEYAIINDQEELKLCRLATRKAFAMARIADSIEKAIGSSLQAAKYSDRK